MYGDGNNSSVSLGINTLQSVVCIAKGGKPDTNWGSARGFKSMHSGGCHFMMADGSVHFFSQSIDMTTLQRLGTIQAGDVPGEH